MAAGVFTPYSTVSPFIGALPPWVPAEDQERIASYQVYEEIYWNHPETFKLVSRGTENRPIYLPSGRVIVETMNRFYGKALGFRIDPLIGTPAEQTLALQAFTSLFARERIKTTWNANKRYGLIRGDMIFHVTADDTKLPGSRISIHPVDPAGWFPVYSDDNLDKLIKVHLVDHFVNAEKKEMVRRQTYEKIDSTIWSSVVEMETSEFAKAAPKMTIVKPPTALPPQITAIPVYHVKNFDEPGNPYGSSELRGLEVVMAAMNQAISDQDLALALEGLGVYTTDGGGPVDENGEESDWVIGPGRVVENAQNFKRVPGIGSVTPYTDHIGTLYSFMKEASGTPDAAIGNVDVQVAESGIALALRMGPILAKSEEKEDSALDVLANMLYDLKAWHSAYEGLNFPDVSVLPAFGDKMPVNRKGEIDLHVAMVMCDPPIMSATTARERLAEKGIVFAADEFTRIIQEKAAMAEAGAPADPDGERLDEEALPDAPDTAQV